MPEDTPSWSETERHRMMMARLGELQSVIEKLADRIVSMDEKNGERSRLYENKIDADMTNLKVRIAMLEVSTKIWCSVISLVGGAISYGLAHLVDKH